MKINFDNIIENESERSYYQELHLKIEEFLQNNSESTFQMITKIIGGSDRRILRLLNEMEICGELILKDKKIFSPNLNKKDISFYDTVCPNCDSKIIPLKSKFKEFQKKMDKIYSQKPITTFIYDQRPVNSETTVRRVAYLLWRNDLVDKEVVVLGDDDLTSIAIGMTNLAKKVTVLDIDERVIKFIKTISEKNHLNIDARVCDFTKQIPEDLKEKFDVFLTDPSPIPECFSTFVLLGLKFLKKESDKVGYVSFFPSHQKESIDFQKILTENSLIITDMIPRFTEYDFVEFTYNEQDKRILKKFDSGEKKINFFENITRVITTPESFENCENISSIKIPLSKAMKRIIEDPTKDPAFDSKDKEFVLEKIGEMKDGL